MTSMRSYIDASEAPPLTETLRYGRPGVLLEASLASRIQWAIERVKTKLDRPADAGLISDAVREAPAAVASDPVAGKTLKRIAQIARAAGRNAALLTVLAGMVGTLVSLSSTPTNVQAAATQIDQTLSGADVDAILDRLAKAGFDVSAKPGLPPELAPVVNKALTALKAIKAFEFKQGTTIESSRQLLTEVGFQGTVTKAKNVLTERVLVTTPDRKLVLASYETIVTTTDAGLQVRESGSGIQVRLHDYLKAASPDSMATIDRFLSDGLGTVNEAAGALTSVQAFLRSRVQDLSRLLALPVATKPDGTYRIIVTATGVTVEPLSESVIAEADAPVSLADARKRLRPGADLLAHAIMTSEDPELARVFDAFVAEAKADASYRDRTLPLERQPVARSAFETTRVAYRWVFTYHDSSWHETPPVERGGHGGAYSPIWPEDAPRSKRPRYYHRFIRSYEGRVGGFVYVAADEAWKPSMREASRYWEREGQIDAFAAALRSEMAKKAEKPVAKGSHLRLVPKV